MSLESQVASLVTATNGLTELVAGRVDAIDAAVATMENQVGSFLHELAQSYTITVDTVGGNDAATDVDGATVRTLAEALRRVKPFHMNIILLANGQTHTFSQDVVTVANAGMTGVDLGHIHIYAATINNIQQPNDDSPLLVWNATLTTMMDITLGGSAAPLKIRHTKGAIVSANPHESWGTGRPQHNQVNIIHSLLDLEAPNTAFLRRGGHLYLRASTINQNAPGALLSQETLEVYDSATSVGGTQGAKRLANVLGDTKPWSTKAIDQRFARVGRRLLYVNTDSGDDNNDGLSGLTPVRSSIRLAELLDSHPAIELEVIISGSADFVLERILPLTGERNILSLAGLTGDLVVPSLPGSDNDGAQVGDIINAFLFVGSTNLVKFSDHAGNPRKTLTLPDKGAYTGNGNSWHYARWQGLFRIGSIWTLRAAHLTIMGADISIGANQTLVALDTGCTPYYQNPYKLVVSYVDCSITLAGENAQTLYGVVQASGTITDAYT
jgi:hypothetical protein